ncbi:MAG: type 1 glutamine amidotransferase [Janthinobacterium lividum]
MLKLLVAESEPRASREQRREATGRSNGETYIDALRAIVPDARFDLHRPAERSSLLTPLDQYDGVFLSGSPLHVYHDDHDVRANVAFMRAVFASGTPSFGSCAGLHIAVVAAGGTVRRNPEGHEIGLARRIAATPEGARHPLLQGRPASFDAPAVHGDEVETLPDGAVLLAGNSATAVQAAEIRQGSSTFWGVQYHPELPLDELAQAIRRQAGELVARGLARSEAEVEAQATLFEGLGREPERLDLAWRLGVDREVIEDERRRTELANAIDHLIRPARARRGRG